MKTQIFEKIMQGMLELEFREKDSVEVAEYISSEIHRNVDKFSKKQIWLLGIRFAWFRERIWDYQQHLI